MARIKRFADWDEEKAPKDYDPEADIPDSQDESEIDEEKEVAGTEHYASVGNSKLRQKETVSLGPQYSGARVSRQALDDDSDQSEEGSESSEDFEDAQEGLESGDDRAEAFDDPETADLITDSARFADEDAEIDSDDALAESDHEKLDKFVFRGSSKPKDAGVKKRRPTAADYISDSAEETDEVDGVDDEEDSDVAEGATDFIDLEAEEETDESELEGDGLDDLVDGLSASESSDDDGEGADLDDDDDDDDESATSDEDEDEDLESKSRARSSDSRAEQRKLMNEGQKALVATMSAAAQQDAEKGFAVRQQRKAFDGLLNIRIRLQKAIVATNSFAAFEGDAEDETEQQSAPAYEAAEEAAFKLLETLDSVRASLTPAQAVGEKRKRGSDDIDVLWAHLQEVHAKAIKHRKKVLENWSAKTRNSTVEVKNRNLLSSKQSVIASLEDQLVNPDRLIRRTRTPRSCAPLQVASKTNEDEAIYDDADFYQLLLKELVDQRTSDETSAQAGNSSLATVRWAAMKEAKTKKHVDRRASKGRKMRFNVHEKLQNFMAPQDRRSWEQDAIDRLFGTLLGQQMELTEVVDEDMDDVNAEEEGLRLFRS